MRCFLIDTDTASDDAVALIMAWRHSHVQVEAVTVVAGNVPLDQALQNALYTAELCGDYRKIYGGASKPLQRPLQTAQSVHGHDGMGDIGLILKGRKPRGEKAIDVIRQTIHSHAGEIELVTLGPLTNIAMALELEPGLARKVKLCTVMGGVGRGHGNVTPVSEYNIWADPEAARKVFESGMNLRMVGWDASRDYAWIDDKEAASLRALDTPWAHFAVDIQRTVNTFAREVSKLPGFDLPDPLAMAVALDPEIITSSRKLFVQVITGEGLTRGQTVVDHMGITGQDPNVEVVLEVSRKKFLKSLHQALQ